VPADFDTDRVLRGILEIDSRGEIKAYFLQQ